MGATVKPTLGWTSDHLRAWVSLLWRHHAVLDGCHTEEHRLSVAGISNSKGKTRNLDLCLHICEGNPLVFDEGDRERYHVPNKAHAWATFTARVARIKFPSREWFVSIFINSTNIYLAPNRIIFILDWPGEILPLWENNSSHGFSEEHDIAFTLYFPFRDATYASVDFIGISWVSWPWDDVKIQIQKVKCDLILEYLGDHSASALPSSSRLLGSHLGHLDYDSLLRTTAKPLTFHTAPHPHFVSIAELGQHVEYQVLQLHSSLAQHISTAYFFKKKEKVLASIWTSVVLRASLSSLTSVFLFRK